MRSLADNSSARVLEQVADILEDGAGTIYSPDFSFYRTLRSGVSAKKKDAVDTIKDADAIGATAGGLVGTLIEPGGGTAGWRGGRWGRRIGRRGDRGSSSTGFFSHSAELDIKAG